MKELIDSIVRYYAEQGPVILLESQSMEHKESRYSYLSGLPTATIKARGCDIEVFEDGRTYSFHDNPWNALAGYCKKWKNYLFGYLGYDLKNHTEKLSSENSDKIAAPDLYFMVPGLLLKIDHQKNKIIEITGSYPALNSIADINDEVKVGRLQSSITKKKYATKVKEIQRDIYEGKYYELNFTHQLQNEFSGSSYNLYKKMRDVGPVPFGAYLQFDGLSVCSLSPERFLCKRGETVFSQPIKGTMKRDANREKDQKLKRRLFDSLKNRAENMMIVDLVRNDLGRIARKGSVEVSNLFDIQSFATVHQMQSTIQAKIEGEDSIEIIKACFPMGSMTGAPKISVMRAIEKLENYRRGIYSGAIGYITPAGDFDFNVVIRTAIIRQNELFYSVGGAITGDSDAKEEWDETWLKAQALLDI